MDANTVIEKTLWPRLIETAYNDLFTLCWNEFNLILFYRSIFDSIIENEFSSPLTEQQLYHKNFTFFH